MRAEYGATGVLTGQSVPVFGARNLQIREALGCLYGAMAAVVRDDLVGFELLVEDLRFSFENFYELLTTISFATLDQLDATIDGWQQLTPDDGRSLATDLLSLAKHYDIASADAVQTAAWLLDAVRRGDHSRVIADIDGARRVTSDDDLVAGSIALLTATVSLWARHTGRSPRRAAAELCMGAAVDAVR